MNLKFYPIAKFKVLKSDLIKGFWFTHGYEKGLEKVFLFVDGYNNKVSFFKFSTSDISNYRLYYHLKYVRDISLSDGKNYSTQYEPCYSFIELTLDMNEISKIITIMDFYQEPEVEVEINFTTKTFTIGEGIKVEISDDITSADFRLNSLMAMDTYYHYHHVFNSKDTYRVEVRNKNAIKVLYLNGKLFTLSLKVEKDTLYLYNAFDPADASKLRDEKDMDVPIFIGKAVKGQKDENIAEGLGEVYNPSLKNKKDMFLYPDPLYLNSLNNLMKLLDQREIEEGVYTTIYYNEKTLNSLGFVGSFGYDAIIGMYPLQVLKRKFLNFL